ncbi:Ppx/GppA family phosphatase [Sutterella massiliensis]|uniref:Ppx/GppA family phosphatase n=1 Tax=Sutterella massiliensis TaxID=1816689 RepID=A0ABS2DNQ6_9BURK|nr:Ppx/GppA phosphatase family protein [Sutterella massiliensis]MBM6703008.1 Ppx/GppA family phosphatase [Sutterella massiliensis]
MLLGAVDLGSNSFRVEIGQVHGDRITTQSYWKETIRLAGGFDEAGALTPEAQARALGALSRFRERLGNLPPERVRAVGTQAMRAATNSAEFLKKAEAALGYKIDILSGHEEARLVFKGCARTLPPSEKRRLIVDIGGASTELIIGEGLEAERCESFRIGCVNTSIRFFQDGRITAKSIERAVLACQAELEESITRFGAGNYEEAFGSAGTFGAMSDIARASGWSDGTVTLEHLERIRKQLLEAKDVKNIRFDGLKEDRKEVIAGGLAVLLAVYKTLGIETMRPASGALRVGLLYDLLGRVSDKDTRDITVESMMSAAQIDREQAVRVADITEKLYTALRPSASPDDLKYVRWGALLHEVGMNISSSRYHRHSWYVVSNADMPGFGRQDQDIMATFVLSQRGNLKKIEDALDTIITCEAAFALRLAVIFAHARRPVELPVMTFIRKGPRELVVKLDGVWLNAHPLTDVLLKDESAAWAKIGRQVTFERF